MHTASWSARVKGFNHIRLLPHQNPDQQETVQTVLKYKDLRLRALQDASEAFSAKLEDEIDFPYEKWLGRVENPAATTLLATQRDDSLPAEESDDWVGMIVIIRQEPRESRSPQASQGDMSEQTELAAIKESASNASTNDPVQVSHEGPTYHLNGLFVLPSARGRGLGKQVVEEAIEVIKIDAREEGFHLVSIKVSVDSRSTISEKRYLDCGFEGKGVETLGEGTSQRQIKMMDLTLNL